MTVGAQTSARTGGGRSGLAPHRGRPWLHRNRARAGSMRLGRPPAPTIKRCQVLLEYPAPPVKPLPRNCRFHATTPSSSRKTTSPKSRERDCLPKCECSLSNSYQISRQLKPYQVLGPPPNGHLNHAEIPILSLLSLRLGRDCPGALKTLSSKSALAALRYL